MILVASVLFLNIIKSIQGLLFPASSTLGLVSSVSAPVVEYFPERRILVDWCFQMTYMLPSEVSEFYNIPIWPGIQTPHTQLMTREVHNDTTKEELYLQHLYEKYNRKIDNNRHSNDFSAGELYQGIEDLLVSYGFHETCLLRSVCELARHPFDEEHQNLLTDIITFFLTPSQHMGFEKSEKVYQETYEAAEMQGFLGEDCSHLFVDCKADILSLMTKLIF